MFYVSIIKCSDGSYYTGFTNDIDKRMCEHAQGKGSFYTSKRLPVELVFLQEFQTKAESLEAERKLKKWNRLKKETVIKKGWESLRSKKLEISIICNF